MEDTYLTISSPSEGYYTEKRSKFYAFAHPVETADEVRELQQFYRKKYYDARHVCYAYRLGSDGSVFRVNDDGEPSSTAGKPIHGALLSAGLTNVVIFVVRYYGGVNLGTGGLIVAYREASRDAIANAEAEGKIVERQVEEQLTFTFPYEQLNDVMRIIKNMQPRILSQDFQATCSVTLSIRKSLMPELTQRLSQLRS